MNQTITKVSQKIFFLLGSIIFLASIMVSLIIFLQKINQAHAQEENRLDIIFPVAERAYLNEVMIDNWNAIPSISKMLKREYQLLDIEISEKKLPCIEKDFLNRQVCKLYQTNKISQIYYIKIISDVPIPFFFNLLNLFFWIFLPFFSIGLLFVFILWKKLNRTIVTPIINLAIAPENFLSKDQQMQAVKEIIDLQCSIRAFIEERDSEREKMIGLQKKAEIGEIAARVAHDVRSPLMTMTSLLQKITHQISKEKAKALAESINSVRDIANNLLEKYKKPEFDLSKKLNELKKIKKVYDNSADSTFLSNNFDNTNLPRYVLLSSIIEMVISQKKYEWENNPCDISAVIQVKIAWFFAAPNDLKRLLSNLLNNAYEALRDKRKVTLILSEEVGFFKLSIKDSGIGIPEEKIAMVLKGDSLKKEGHGLGLSGAKKMMEGFGGNLTVSSVVNEGTEVVMTFAIPPTPVWFTTEMELPNKMPILLLDDEPSIHNLWRDHIYPRRMMHCMAFDEVLVWMAKKKETHPEEVDQIAFIMDCELAHDSRTGLDLLERFQPGKHGYLMTSRAEDITIQTRCEKAGLWLIPKEVFNEITIKWSE